MCFGVKVTDYGRAGHIYTTSCSLSFYPLQIYSKPSSALTKQVEASLISSVPLFKMLEATEKSAAPTAVKYDLQLAVWTSLLL